MTLRGGEVALGERIYAEEVVRGGMIGVEPKRGFCLADDVRSPPLLLCLHGPRQMLFDCRRHGSKRPLFCGWSSCTPTFALSGYCGMGCGMATSVRDALNLINGGRAEEGVQLLRRIASTQDSEALFLLGELTWAGTLVAQEPGRARLMIEYAAAFGHPEANILATNLLGSGVAGRRDWQAAVARLEAEARVLPNRKAAWDLIEAMQLDTNGDPLAVP